MDWIPIIGENLARLESQFVVPPHSRFREGAMAKAPFYAHGDIVRVSNGENNVYMVAVGIGDLESRLFLPLNGSARDVIDANDAAGLNMTEENAMEYLRFFLDHVRASTGERFVITESLDGFCLIDEEHQHRPKPVDMRLIYKGSPSAGNFAFRAYISFPGILSAATMVVHANGSVDMTEEEPQGYIVPAHREPEVFAGRYH